MSLDSKFVVKYVPGPSRWRFWLSDLLRALADFIRILANRIGVRTTVTREVVNYINSCPGWTAEDYKAFNLPLPDESEDQEEE